VGHLPPATCELPQSWKLWATGLLAMELPSKIKIPALAKSWLERGTLKISAALWRQFPALGVSNPTKIIAIR
jgi:hypothetical protein